MITNNVIKILMRIFSFSDKSNIEEYLEYGKQLSEVYANGKDIKIKIIE